MYIYTHLWDHLSPDRLNARLGQRRIHTQRNITVPRNTTYFVYTETVKIIEYTHQEKTKFQYFKSQIHFDMKRFSL